MPRTTETLSGIIAAARRLSERDRDKLLRELIADLGPPPFRSPSSQEIDRRLNEMRAGTVKTYSLDEVAAGMDRAIRSARRRRG